MRKVILAASVAALTLSACSQEKADDGSVETMQVAEEATADAELEAEQAPREPQAELAPIASQTDVTEVEEPADEPQGRATMPDFTYSHQYRFEAAASDVAQMQDAHVAACDTMGQQQCRIANFRQDMDGVAGIEASLELYVASDKIRSLATEMTSIARDFDGERVQANIIGTEATQRLDEAQLRIGQNLTQKDRLQAIIDDRRSSRAEKQNARDQLATLNTTLNANRRQLDNIASDIGFTKMDVSYSGTYLFGPLLPYALIIVLMAGIAALVYRLKQLKFDEPATA